MDRIKVRQQKFKRGKEKMLSLVQESVDGQPAVRPIEDEEDDDGMKKPAGDSDKTSCCSKMVDVTVSHVHVV